MSDPEQIALDAIANASHLPVRREDLKRLLGSGEGEGSHLRALFGDVDLHSLLRLAALLEIDDATLVRAYARARGEAAAVNADLDEYASDLQLATGASMTFSPMPKAPRAIITAIEITRHRLPLDPPFRASWDTQARTHFDAAVVRVHTDLGVTGVGSGDMMLGFEGHEHLFVGQDAMQIERHWRILNNISFHWGRCWPLDLALWDLAGKIAGQPVWKLLGGLSDRVRALMSSRQSPRWKRIFIAGSRAQVALGRVGHRGGLAQRAGRGIGAHAVGQPAEQLPDGLAGDLAGEVPEREVERPAAAVVEARCWTARGSDARCAIGSWPTNRCSWPGEADHQVAGADAVRPVVGVHPHDGRVEVCAASCPSSRGTAGRVAAGAG